MVHKTYNNVLGHFHSYPIQLAKHCYYNVLGGARGWAVGAVSDGVEGGRARPQADFVGGIMDYYSCLYAKELGLFPQDFGIYLRSPLHS